MKVLEEFWYGDIRPIERQFHNQRKFDKVFKLLAKNEEKLLEVLSTQEKELVDGSKSCYSLKKQNDLDDNLERSVFCIYK